MVGAGFAVVGAILALLLVSGSAVPAEEPGEVEAVPPCLVSVQPRRADHGSSAARRSGCSRMTQAPQTGDWSVRGRPRRPR